MNNKAVAAGLALNIITLLVVFAKTEEIALVFAAISLGFFILSLLSKEN